MKIEIELTDLQVDLLNLAIEKAHDHFTLENMIKECIDTTLHLYLDEQYLQLCNWHGFHEATDECMICEKIKGDIETEARAKRDGEE